ncbi:MAG: hypothetical protein WAX77_12750 [Methylococcaceae bacterium]
MDIVAIFNYFESGLWFIIALVLFLKRNNPNAELKKLTITLSISFIVFSISDVIEASTGAWWRPLWLLGLKALCILSFSYCWICYNKIKNS